MKYCYVILSKLLILSQYLNHDVDCMFIDMYHWQKSSNCNMNVKEPSKLHKVIDLDQEMPCSHVAD